MTPSTGRLGVLVINFGEPEEASVETVVPFLERIFLQNAGLEPEESVLERARQLARERAPGLVEEYEAIGGSPLNRQARAQSDGLTAELGARGFDVRAYAAFQFTEPSIERCVEEARRDGAETLVALPVYPICGRSTTVAALETTRSALSEQEWTPRFAGIAGWHHHPDYERLRTEHIRAFVAERGLALSDPDTRLYFSVHGTPIKYLDEGNRYDRYVDEQCRAIAEALGGVDYAVGFQNHTNRRIAWTRPDNEDAIEAIEETQLVVVPLAFMHEQSETLAELDHELRVFAEGLGKTFHRVPVPHADPAFVTLLADLVESALDAPASDGTRLTACRCAPLRGVRCTNGHRELSPSPFGAEAPTA